jgi:hypothetical protein
MDEEVAAALELENQILAAPGQSRDALAFESGGNRFGRLGARHARVDDLDVFQPATLEARSQPGANGLDLG